MNESLDQIIREETTRNSIESGRLSRKVGRIGRTRLLRGISFGLVLLLSGTVLITSEGFGFLVLAVLGFIFLPWGLWIIVSSILGGLGPDARGIWPLRFP